MHKKCYPVRNFKDLRFNVIWWVIFLVDQRLRDLREKIRQNYKQLSIRELCVKRSGEYHLIFFDLNGEFRKMVDDITEMKRSRIFEALWQKYSNKLKDKEVTIQDIFNEIWLRICSKLKLVIQRFLSGEIQLMKIDKYLSMFNGNFADFEEEFKLLSSFFCDATHLDQVEKTLSDRMQQVKSYKKLFVARQAAQAILELRQKMGLKGDFSEVAKIEEVVLYAIYT